MTKTSQNFRNRWIKRLLTGAVLSTALASCGGSSGGAEDGDAGLSGTVDLERYFPIAVGASWGYEVQSGGSTGTKVQAVLALEDLGGANAGTLAYKVQSTKPSGKITISWQQDTGAALVRHREQTFASDQSQETEETYSPAKLRLDENADNLIDGASYEYTYEEIVLDFATNQTTTLSKTETWTVEAVDVLVTVPAGPFSCIQIRKFNAGTGSDKRYWFAKGVGKVREESATQIEELTTYRFP
jgi:hypothetical protein